MQLILGWYTNQGLVHKTETTVGLLERGPLTQGYYRYDRAKKPYWGWDKTQTLSIVKKLPLILEQEGRQDHLVKDGG